MKYNLNNLFVGKKHILLNDIQCFKFEYQVLPTIN